MNSTDRIHASHRSMYPADHATAAKLATFDLVTVAAHNGIPNLTLAQIARDETEYLADDCDRLRAINAELVAALQRCLTHFENIRAIDRDDSPMMAQARAALAKARQS